ncbi:unnamed protein product [Litomosoides sigmodontis]|uniref:Thioredoxin domain-containing protein n=1 Tax=Litomosoides sigmodontis TaxID=42156 RepID=A0A3P6T093_LITSI|nr:unnamed protein product [Litomosoides sigmodontis]
MNKATIRKLNGHGTTCQWQKAHFRVATFRDLLGVCPGVLLSATAIFCAEYLITDGMFNSILIAHLLLCITRIIECSDISKDDNATSSEVDVSARKIVMYCHYPKDAFQVLIRSQCPATHPFCVIDAPFDVLINQKYRCATAPRRTDFMVHFMNSSQLLAQVDSDNELYNGHASCMLTAFYSPDCAFSTRMMSYLYHLPRMYPRLRIVATDARDHSKLNSRYGIIGTPTILLWIDGNVVSRMDEAPFSLQAFKNYVEKWTDLELEHKEAMENESALMGNMHFHKSNFDWYLCLSWCSFLLSTAYFFFNSKYGHTFWETIRKNYIRTNEAGL